MTEGITKRELLKATAGIGAIGAAAGTGQANKRPTRTEASSISNRYIVGITPTADRMTSALNTAREYADTIHREIDMGDIRRVVVGEYTDVELAEVRSMDAVEYVEQDGFYEPQSTGSGEETTVDPAVEDVPTYPWGIDRIGASGLHRAGYTGEGADIAILDTGTDPTHPALGPNVGVGRTFEGYESESTDCVEEERRYENVECMEPWDDDDRHGTHVSGTAGAADKPIDENENPYVDPDQIAGVAPEATVHGANVFEWRYDGDWMLRAPWSTTAAALNWVADQGYDVANLSLGGPESSNTLRDAVRYAAINGVVVVASAGNDGGDDCDEDCVGYPAAYDDAIAVAATTPNDDVASFSSRGPEVEVAAPGTSIVSAMPPHIAENFDYIGRYSSMQGTSMAAPHVTGLAALVKAHTDLEDNDEIRERIRQTTEDLGHDEIETGEGLIDATAALDVDTPPLVTTGVPTNVGTTELTLTGEVHDFGTATDVEVHFEYGPAGSDLDETVHVGTVSSTGAVSTTVSGLDDNTTYEVRAVATGAGGLTDTGTTTTVTTVSLACPYTNETGVVDEQGLRDAVREWQAGEADTDTLASTLDAWQHGEPVTSCP